MDSPDRKRLLIAFGASQFATDAGGFPPLPDADQEIARIEKSLGACGYQPVCTEIRLNANANAIRTKVCGFFGEHSLVPEDVVALYFTGHGESVNKVHYLCPAESHPRRLPATAIKASDLAEWIYNTGNLPRDRRPGNLLLILDACWAEEGVDLLLSTIGSVLRGGVPGGEGGIAIICAARRNEYARAGALAEALEQVVQDDAYAPRQQRYLRVLDLVDGLNTRLTSQQARVDLLASRGKQVFLLNPRFTVQYVGRSLEEAELAAHFAPRARGVETSDELGNFFTGRREALAEIEAFLASDGRQSWPLVVTGDPGSGKSAVLGRVVVESALVDHKIHARRATTASIVDRIAGAVAVSARTPQELIAAMGRAPRPLRLVVDALDEAENAPEVAADVLRPLAAVPGVSLVVGTRRPLLDWLGQERIIDLDDDRYFAGNDVSQYVERRLLETAGSTYLGDRPRARAVAEVLGERAGHSFLVAAVQARSLAGRSPVDPNDPTWRDELTSDLGVAFERDLKSRFSDRSELVKQVLMPLAFAGGRGIPQESVWADVASRMAGKTITNEEINEAKRLAGFYITPDVEDEVGVYRLYHERFAEHFRTGSDARSAHTAFVASLRSSVSVSGDQPRWQLARPYARRHLARHAAECGELAELINDLGYVVHAAPAELLAALLRTPEARSSPIGEVFLLEADRLRRAPAPGERAQYLRWAALRQQNLKLADTLMALDLPTWWRVVWTQLPVAHPHFVMGRHLSAVHAVVFGRIDGVPVVVSGSRDNTVRLWAARSGQPRGTPLQGHEDRVCSVSLGDVDGVPVVVSGGDDNTVRLWDARSGQPRGTPLQGHERLVSSVSLGDVDGIPVVVSGSWDKTVRLWAARSGQPRGTPLQGHEGLVSSVSLGDVDGVPVVVSGSDDNTVRLWAARSGQPRGTPLQGHKLPVCSVSLGDVDGVPVVVSSSWDTVRLWDARSGQLRGTPLQGHEDSVSSVSLGDVDGVPVVASGSWDESVRLWDARTGQPIGRILQANQAVSMRRGSGRLAICSGNAVTMLELFLADPQQRSE